MDIRLTIRDNNQFLVTHPGLDQSVQRASIPHLFNSRWYLAAVEVGESYRKSRSGFMADW
jgi:hypothetical protein